MRKGSSASCMSSCHFHTPNRARTKGQHNVLDPKQQWGPSGDQELGREPLPTAPPTISCRPAWALAYPTPTPGTQGRGGRGKVLRGPQRSDGRVPSTQCFPVPSWVVGERREAERPFQAVKPRPHSRSGLLSHSPSIPFIAPPIPGPEIA